MYPRYLAEDTNKESVDALDTLQLIMKRYCRRRTVLIHVDLIKKLLHYNCASFFGFFT
ncbi:hypothetical protein BT96DRAFT_388767 [Gymnopus androsaceus JB14]|uniref:Uncharacterized protein n=1 Tax=Gymnopus androsaceus JB14 TaxID=1447944 RepID=A0A6A4I7L1_9AGAR|nr:hypothetical protein BT96DRAFT_388767 [Gymnopus androsaceus JB14]